MGQVNVTVLEQPIGMIPQKDPALRGVYVTGITDAAGVVAANNYMTLVNPVGSGRIVVVLGVFISCYVAAGSSNARNSMQGQVATAVSAGTLVIPANIAKFQSGMPNAVAEVRTGNPTATAGANIFNSPPPINSAAGQYVHSVGYGAATSSGAYTLLPGEGVVLRTVTGNVAQTWNISIEWGEI
jgi:hypothetical protein